MILTLAQYKSLQGITVATNDTLISALLTPVQAAIESYCDRKFDTDTYYQWFSFSQNVVLPQYPVTQISMLGYSEVFASIVITGEFTIEIKSDRISVTTGAFVTTDFTFAAFANITLITAAITAAFPTITFTLTATYATATPYRLRTGVVYDTLYGAAPSKLAYRIPDDSNRIIEIGFDLSLGFVYAWDEYFKDTIFVCWKGGYTSTSMPTDLQLLMSNIVRDIVDADTSNITGLFKSESLTNYSYTLADPSQIRRFLSKYYEELENWKKKTI